MFLEFQRIKRNTRGHTLEGFPVLFFGFWQSGNQENIEYFGS